MSNEYLPQLHQRVCGYKVDLEAFLRVISELSVPGDLPDVKRKQLESMAVIKVNTWLILDFDLYNSLSYLYFRIIFKNVIHF